MDEKHIKDKLNAPKKISEFERRRQEADTKRLRDEAETRKALRDFQNSFDDDDEDEDDAFSAMAGRKSASGGMRSRDAPPPEPRGGAMSGSLGGPRHFGNSMRNSGPGTLGPAPPPSLKRKAEMNEELEAERRSREGRGGGGGGIRGLDDQPRSGKSPEPAARRPTMLLAHLPKSMQEAEVKKLIPSNLKVEDVSFVPPAAPGSDRRHRAAIVAVAADTPMSDVDGCVLALQTKYLGHGCYLKISRHITSSVGGGLGSSLLSHNLGTGADFQPFGAKLFRPDQQNYSLRNAPPPEALDNPYGQQGGYGQRRQGPAPMVVTVTPPSDLKLLKAVHMTVEKTIKYGGLFEQTLLSSSEVQNDEQWAWFFDSTSQASIYYRWLLYEHHAAKSRPSTKSAINTIPSDEWTRTPEGQFAKKNGLLRLYDHGPLFQPPRERPKFEFTFDFEDLIQDSGYASSSDESDDEGKANPMTTADRPGNVSSTQNYLNPYRRAKFIHLLHRVPETLSYLRAGDIARITHFVVSNAGSGAEEIVSLLLENIEHPYSRCVAYTSPLEDLDPDDPDDHEALEKRARNEDEKRKADPSNAKLIALYCVSDAIQASSTSGVRDAWKYRGLFESALLARGTFAHLGRLEKEYGWGRIKTEQWKRKVGVVLTAWENASIFSADTQRVLKEAFVSPPLSAKESKAEKADVEREEKEKREGAKWKSGTSTPVFHARDASAAPSAATAQSGAAAPLAAAVSKDVPKTDTSGENVAGSSPNSDAKPAAAMAERIALLKKTVRAARPTAADLLDKKEETPTPAPAPKISVGSFKMSLGGGAVGGARLSLGGGKGADKDMEDDEGESGRKRRGLAGDMFGDSDGE